MSAGITIPFGDLDDITKEELLVLAIHQAQKIMTQDVIISSLKQEISQLKQQINSGTTLVKASPDLQHVNKKAGAHKIEVTQKSFCDSLKEEFQKKADLIIRWIKNKIDLLNKDLNYCSALTGNCRLMAPLYVVIQAGVFIPKNSNDARPVLKGTSLERYFTLPEYSYKNYSKPRSYSPGAIQKLTESFQTEVLNSA